MSDIDCTQRIVEDVIPTKIKVATLYILGTNYSIFSGINNIGRDPSKSDIFLDHPTISKSHAVIRVIDKQHIILDLDSTNKTIVESKVILIPYDRYDLKHNSSIQFGEIHGKYFYDEEDQESQIANTNQCEIQRPTNPIEKLFDSDTDINVVDCDIGDRTSSPSSPILNSSITKRKKKYNRIKVQIDSQSVFDAETQISNKGDPCSSNELGVEGKFPSDSDCIHYAETQFTNKNDQQLKSHGLKFDSSLSIHDAETQVTYKVENIKEVPSQNSSSEHLRLSESLTEDSIHTAETQVTGLNNLSSFCIPDTQDVLGPIAKSKKSISVNVSIADSQCDTTNEPVVIDESDEDSNEVINYKEDSNSSDTNYANISSQCLLRSYTVLPECVTDVDCNLEDSSKLPVFDQPTQIVDSEPKNVQVDPDTSLDNVLVEPTEILKSSDTDFKVTHEMERAEESTVLDEDIQETQVLSCDLPYDTGNTLSITSEMNNTDNTVIHIKDVFKKPTVINSECYDKIQQNLPSSGSFNESATISSITLKTICSTETKLVDEVNEDIFLEATQLLPSKSITEVVYNRQSLVDQGIFDQPTQVFDIDSENINIEPESSCKNDFVKPKQILNHEVIDDDIFNMATQVPTSKCYVNKSKKVNKSVSDMDNDSLFDELTQKINTGSSTIIGQKSVNSTGNDSMFNEPTQLLCSPTFKDPETLEGRKIEREDEENSFFNQSTQMITKNLRNKKIVRHSDEGKSDYANDSTFAEPTQKTNHKNSLKVISETSSNKIDKEDDIFYEQTQLVPSLKKKSEKCVEKGTDIICDEPEIAETSSVLRSKSSRMGKTEKSVKTKKKSAKANDSIFDAPTQKFNSDINMPSYKELNVFTKTKQLIESVNDVENSTRNESFNQTNELIEDQTTQSSKNDIYDQTTQIFPGHEIDDKDEFSNQETQVVSDDKLFIPINSCNEELKKSAKLQADELESLNVSTLSAIGNDTKHSGNFCEKLLVKKLKKYTSSTPVVTDKKDASNRKEKERKNIRSVIAIEGSSKEDGSKNDSQLSNCQKSGKSESSERSLGIVPLRQSLSEDNSEHLEDDSDAELKAEYSMTMYTSKLNKSKVRVIPKDLFGDSSESEKEEVEVKNSNILYGKKPLKSKRSQKTVQAKTVQLEGIRKSSRARKRVKHFDDLFGDSETADENSEKITSSRSRSKKISDTKLSKIEPTKKETIKTQKNKTESPSSENATCRVIKDISESNSSSVQIKSNENKKNTSKSSKLNSQTSSSKKDKNPSKSESEQENSENTSSIRSRSTRRNKSELKSKNDITQNNSDSCVNLTENSDNTNASKNISDPNLTNKETNTDLIPAKRSKRAKNKEVECTSMEMQNTYPASTRTSTRVSNRSAKTIESNHLSESTQDNIMVPEIKRSSTRQSTIKESPKIAKIRIKEEIIEEVESPVEDSNIRRRSSKRRFDVKEETQENVEAIGISPPKKPKKKGVKQELTMEDNGKVLRQNSITHMSPKVVIRNDQKEKYRVLFTSVNDENLAKMVHKLGGSVVDFHNQCSVLIAPRIIRTVKFLCCLAKGIPIVSADWLVQSAKAHTFLDPWLYVTLDKAGEAKYKFDLKKSLRRAQSSLLLKGYTVMGTANIIPQVKETQDIVESSGGKFVHSIPSKGFQEPAFIISCEEDRKFWPKKGKKYSPPIVKAECLLTGILQQRLNIPLHLLT